MVSAGSEGSSGGRMSSPAQDGVRVRVRARARVRVRVRVRG